MNMKTSRFQIPAELSVFLRFAEPAASIDPLPGVDQSFNYEFTGPQSVKHLFEAAGIPHTEVSACLVNGNPVSLDYQVQDGDQVELRSYMQVQPAQMAPQSSPPRFLLDNHLGKLANLLRMLGFDCLYQNSYQDEQLSEIAQAEGRNLLTRDHLLLMRKTIEQGYWLRSQDPVTQLKEVLTRYSLFEQIEPFRRCMRCNELLLPIEKEKILHRLQPLTRQYFDEFQSCPNCQQIYWKGSHYQKMTDFINELTAGKPIHTEEPFASPVTVELQKKDIPFRLFRHTGPVHSLEQAATERGQAPEQVIRSILFRLSPGSYLMVLVAGQRQISWQSLRKAVGQSRLTLATEEEVFAVTGYRLGAVTPFGLPQPIPIYIDESVFCQDEISIGSGVRGVALLLRTTDLLRALGSFTRGSFS